MADLFSYWTRIPRGGRIHPADAPILGRVRHRFDLSCLPAPFTGPLRTAKLVLLFLAPGLADDNFDAAHSLSDKGQNWYQHQLGGLAPLPDLSEHPPHYAWWSKKVRQFGVATHDARSSVAVLDLAPYHSRTFHDWPMLSALPSCRTALDWAQSELFPAARAGHRMVVCLRSPEYWGLRRGAAEGSLFSPEINRGGFMLRGEQRERIIASATALFR